MQLQNQNCLFLVDVLHIRLNFLHYYNSVENLSVYAGHRQEINNFGFEAAFVTGYNNGSLTPYIRGTYDIGKMRMFIAPGIESEDIGVVLGVEIRLK